MMIVVGCLHISGFFEQLRGMAFAASPPRGACWLVTIALSGLLSAFLVNDIVCLALTPLIIHLARRLRFDPIPHLIGLATAANIGSAGTITGNPQNMIIGCQSGIAYVRFPSDCCRSPSWGWWSISFVIACGVSPQACRCRAAKNRQSPRDRQRGPTGMAAQQPAHRRLRRKSGDRQRWLAVVLFSGPAHGVGCPRRGGRAAVDRSSRRKSICKSIGACCSCSPGCSSWSMRSSSMSWQLGDPAVEVLLDRPVAC